MPYKDESYLLMEDLISQDVTIQNVLKSLSGNEEKGSAAIITRLDNLGKGASGAAIQNMNLMLGLRKICTSIKLLLKLTLIKPSFINPSFIILSIRFIKEGFFSSNTIFARKSE